MSDEVKQIHNHNLKRETDMQNLWLSFKRLVKRDLDSGIKYFNTGLYAELHEMPQKVTALLLEAALKQHGASFEKNAQGTIFKIKD